MTYGNSLVWAVRIDSRHSMRTFDRSCFVCKYNRRVVIANEWTDGLDVSQILRSVYHSGTYSWRQYFVVSTRVAETSREF